MQVSVETTSGLERRMTVTVPAERVDKEVESRLKSMTRTVRLAGFRPGKVPVKVVTTRFGVQVRKEVIGELTQSSFQEAVTQENLRLAGMPQIEAKDSDPGADMEYIATFEVFGEIKMAPLADIEIDRPVATISDDDVNAMVEKLRKQRADWVVVERPAQDGDRLIIDFEGSIDGEGFQGNKGEQAPIVLGSKSFIPGFEDGLVGAKSGDELTIENLTFPEDYQAKAVAGKPVQFVVKVSEVAEADLPEVNAEFMSAFEVSDGNMDSFLKEIRGSMQSEMDQVLKSLLKDKLFDALYEKNPIDVPAALIENSINDILGQMKEKFGAQGGDLSSLDRSVFEPVARKKAVIALLMSDISNKQALAAQPDDVKQIIEDLAQTYDDPDEVVRWYYADQSRMQTIEAIARENMVIEWVLEQAKVKDITMSFDELMVARKS